MRFRLMSSPYYWFVVMPVEFRERGSAAMPSSSAQRAPTVEYLNCVEREDELVRLRNQARIRKSLLLYGPEGVGKSRLLRAFVKNQTLALYVGQMRSPRDFALILIQALHSADGGIKVLLNCLCGHRRRSCLRGNVGADGDVASGKVGGV